MFLIVSPLFIYFFKTWFLSSQCNYTSTQRKAMILEFQLILIRQKTGFRWLVNVDGVFGKNFWYYFRLAPCLLHVTVHKKNKKYIYKKGKRNRGNMVPAAKQEPKLCTNGSWWFKGWWFLCVRCEPRVQTEHTAPSLSIIRSRLISFSVSHTWAPQLRCD